jgi:hypothetical protein
MSVSPDGYIVGPDAVFEELGCFETNVVDSTGLDPQMTVELVAEGLREHRFELTVDHRLDMIRLAAKYGTMS